MNALESAVEQEREQAEHQHRVKVLEESGWARDGDAWLTDLGDLRWSEQKIVRYEGSTFVENTRAAWNKEMQLRAEELRRRQQKGAA